MPAPAGRATLRFAVAADAALVDSRLFAQALVADVFRGGRLTPLLRQTIVP